MIRGRERKSVNTVLRTGHYCVGNGYHFTLNSKENRKSVIKWKEHLSPGADEIFRVRSFIFGLEFLSVVVLSLVYKSTRPF